MKVADQVWIALALLHREHPDREGFTPLEIKERVRQEFDSPVRAGINTHVSQHCVATKRPDPGRYRMLVDLEDGRRRLFRPGDPYHLDREGGKVKPRSEDLPERYLSLLDWYASEYAAPWEFGPDHPLLALSGIGASGLRDVSENHDLYLAEAARSHAEPA